MNESSELKNFNISSSYETSDYENLVDQIITRVSALSQAGFEQMVTDLLIRMGYEVYRNAKRRLNLASIHGIIIEDGPGYRPIYIHTRKLERGSIVTTWSMQGFGDAVERKAGRGLLVTNASFSRPAQDYAKQKKIILIDGNILSRLMIVNDFCMDIKEIVEIKSIDPNAFQEYEKQK